MKLYIIVLSLILSDSLFSQTTINLPANTDNSMYSESGSLSNGAGDFLFAGRNGQSNIRRALIKFDLSSIPSGSTISAVTLTLRGSNGGPSAVELHRLTSDWGEGASDAAGPEGMGAMAQPNDATWLNTFFSALFWTTPGGDFASTISAVTNVDEGVTSSWTSTQMIDDVQQWIDGANPNFGWIMIGDEINAGEAVRMNSRENSSNPPNLSITYTTGCVMDDTLMGTINSGTYQVSNDLTVTNGLINPGAMVIMIAGNSITINGDTEFSIGAEIELNIGPCP